VEVGTKKGRAMFAEKDNNGRDYEEDKREVSAEVFGMGHELRKRISDISDLISGGPATTKIGRLLFLRGCIFLFLPFKVSYASSHGTYATLCPCVCGTDAEDRTTADRFVPLLFPPHRQGRSVSLDLSQTSRSRGGVAVVVNHGAQDFCGAGTNRTGKSACAT